MINPTQWSTLYIYQFSKQLNIFSRSNRPHGIFQNEYNYIIEKKLKTTCFQEVIGKRKKSSPRESPNWW